MMRKREKSLCVNFNLRFRRLMQFHAPISRYLKWRCNCQQSHGPVHSHTQIQRYVWIANRAQGSRVISQVEVHFWDAHHSYQFSNRWQFLSQSKWCSDCINEMMFNCVCVCVWIWECVCNIWTVEFVRIQLTWTNSWTNERCYFFSTTVEPDSDSSHLSSNWIRCDEYFIIFSRDTGQDHVSLAMTQILYDKK